jgi:hypothetical protein
MTHREAGIRHGLRRGRKTVRVATARNGFQERVSGPSPAPRTQRAAAPPTHHHVCGPQSVAEVPLTVLSLCSVPR